MRSSTESLLGESVEADERPKNRTSVRLAHVIDLWTTVTDSRSSRPCDFFRRIELAKDGGVSDITAEKLLYSTQYVNAAMSAIFILLNTVYITVADFHCVFYGRCGQGSPDTSVEATCIKFRTFQCNTVECITNVAAACQADPVIPQPFLLTRSMLFDEVPAERIIACFEFFLLWLLIFRAVRLSLMASCATIEVYQWVCVTQIFWQTLPSVSCFSLMRLLYYVTPSVIGTEAYYVFSWTMERIRQDQEKNFANTWPMVRYVGTRLLCAIIGFDAFLMKFRLASNGVLHESPSLLDCTAAVLFLFQVLGVVNLTWFVRQRLFLFIFGGENGDMSNEGKAHEIVWNAMVARKIYQNLGLFQFLVIMLGFDDYDFQVLVMEKTKAKSIRLDPVCPKGHVMKLGRTPFPRCDVCSSWHSPMSSLWGCRKCNFDACDRCKYETQIAENLPERLHAETLFGRLQAWLLSMAIE